MKKIFTRPKDVAVLFIAAISISLAISENSIAEAENTAFYDYLHQANPLPAMIAYNPSNINPDKPQLSVEQMTEKVHSDLNCLRSGFDGLVLYSYSPDITPIVIDQANSLGYRGILLGIWDVKSKQEISGVLELIRKYNRKLAFAVVVGNEGINDNRYSLEDVKATGTMLSETGLAKMNIPMTTSEPMSRYGLVELRNFGDFLAPNIHPLFDRADLGPKEAVNWVHSRADALAKIAKKPVFVKETGLPNGGNPNNTPEQQYEFWSTWHDKGSITNLTNIPNLWISFAAIFEAFDSPWKAVKSGNPVEGRWGLLNEKLQKYPAFDVFSDKNQTCFPSKK